MHSTGSYILGALEMIRAYLDDPELDAKYNNDWIIRNLLGPSMNEVWMQVNRDSSAPITIRFDIALVTSTEYYTLPPCIQYIWRLAKLDTDGTLLADARPRNELHPSGPGWNIEGGVLRINPLPTANQTITIWYVPSGDIGLHYASTGATFTSSSGVHRVTLPASITYGWLDKRENAYAGATFRLLNTSGTWEERTIASYDNTTRVAIMRTNFSSLPTDNTPYEIVPSGSQILWEAIAGRAAMRLGAIRKISGPHLELLREQYGTAMKGIRDMMNGMQGRTGAYFDRVTIDNPDVSWYVWHY